MPLAPVLALERLGQGGMGGLDLDAAVFLSSFQEINNDNLYREKRKEITATSTQDYSEAMFDDTLEYRDLGGETCATELFEEYIVSLKERFKEKDWMREQEKDDDENDQGEAGLSKSGNELKKLLHHAEGQSESDDSDHKDTDEESPPPVLAPKLKDEFECEPQENNPVGEEEGGIEDFDLDFDIEIGDDWEYQQTFSDDDEGVDPEEGPDFADTENPAPPEIKQDDEENEQGAGSLSKSSKELKELISHAEGQSGYDDNDHEDTDEESPPPVLAPKLKDKFECEPHENNPAKRTATCSPPTSRSNQKRKSGGDDAKPSNGAAVRKPKKEQATVGPICTGAPTLCVQRTAYSEAGPSTDSHIGVQNETNQEASMKWDKSSGEYQYQSQLEASQSATATYYLLMMHGKEFHAVPAGSWYNFSKIAQYKRLTLEEAEEKMKRRRSNATGYKRWMMKSATHGAAAFGSDLKNLDDVKAKAACGVQSKKENRNEDENHADKDEEGEEEGGIEDFDLDFDIEIGDDWEHKEIFSDEVETGGVDPEEGSNFADTKNPAPPEIKQDDDEKEQGEGGRSKSGKELKKLLCRAEGQSGSDDNYHEDTDEESPPPVLTPKLKDEFECEPQENNPAKPTSTGLAICTPPTSRSNQKRKSGGDDAKPSNGAALKKPKKEADTTDPICTGAYSEAGLFTETHIGVQNETNQEAFMKCSQSLMPIKLHKKHGASESHWKSGETDTSVDSVQGTSILCNEFDATQVFVNLFGKCISIQENRNLLSVKLLLEAACEKAGMQLTDVYSTFCGKIMEPEHPLSYYQIQKDSTIRVNHRVRAGAGRPQTTIYETWDDIIKDKLGTILSICHLIWLTLKQKKHQQHIYQTI